MSGYVYVMSNPVHSLLKIGYSSKHPKERAKELYGTNSPEMNIVEYWVKLDEYQVLESLVHDDLNEHRFNNRREFFSCDLKTAITTIKILSKLLGGVESDFLDENKHENNQEGVFGQSNTEPKMILCCAWCYRQNYFLATEVKFPYRFQCSGCELHSDVRSQTAWSRKVEILELIRAQYKVAV